MSTRIGFLLMFSFFLSMLVHADWLQLQGNAQRSGNVPGEVLNRSLGLMAAIPLTDGVQASPVVADGVVYVLDGSGVVHAIDAKTFEVKWRFATKGGAGNCNNVAAPAVVGKYLHVDLDFVYYHEGQPVRLKESRRVKLRETHYFDHPLFGIIVELSPYALPEAIPEGGIVVSGGTLTLS